MFEPGFQKKNSNPFLKLTKADDPAPEVKHDPRLATIKELGDRVSMLQGLLAAARADLEDEKRKTDQWRQAYETRPLPSKTDAEAAADLQKLRQMNATQRSTIQVQQQTLAQQRERIRELEGVQRAQWATLPGALLPAPPFFAGDSVTRNVTVGGMPNQLAWPVAPGPTGAPHAAVCVPQETLGRLGIDGPQRPDMLARIANLQQACANDHQALQENERLARENGTYATSLPPTALLSALGGTLAVDGWRYDADAMRWTRDGE